MPRAASIPIRISFFILLSITSLSWATVPTSFTYQGSVKQNGVPLNGTYSIELRITNADGSALYWTSGAQSTPVKEGLYRMELNPTTVDWNNVEPYIETRVNGNTFLPREKLTSSIYAQIAKGLAVGAVANGDLTVRGSLVTPQLSVTNRTMSWAQTNTNADAAYAFFGGDYSSVDNGGTPLWLMAANKCDGLFTGCSAVLGRALLDITNAGRDLFVVHPKGQVGIGGPGNPGYQLSVYSDINNHIVKLENANALTTILFSPTHTDKWMVGHGIGGWNAFAIFDYPQNIFRFYIDSISGNTAIGGNDVSEKLVVDGNIKLKGMVKSEQNLPAFFVNVFYDDCNPGRAGMGCPAGYISGGSWHTKTNSTTCDGNIVGHGYTNGDVGAGWIGLCIAQ